MLPSQCCKSDIQSGRPNSAASVNSDHRCICFSARISRLSQQIAIQAESSPVGRRALPFCMNYVSCVGVAWKFFLHKLHFSNCCIHSDPHSGPHSLTEASSEVGQMLVGHDGSPGRADRLGILTIIPSCLLPLPPRLQLLLQP